MPRGGHFAVFEQPELFIEDVRAFICTQHDTGVACVQGLRPHGRPA